MRHSPREDASSFFFFFSPEQAALKVRLWSRVESRGLFWFATGAGLFKVRGCS